MMKFRTEVIPEQHKGLITHRGPILTLGSCFADNVGERLEKDLFNVLHNPFGPLYNPASIAKIVELVNGKCHFQESCLFFSEGLWRSWHCHTKLCKPDKKETLGTLNGLIDKTFCFVQDAKTAIITLGTAYVYRRANNGEVTANCHKIPQKFFRKELLYIDSCTAYLKQSIDLLRSLNPQINIILTVSPIRHLADGFHGNLISKSILILAVENVLSTIERTYYFPAYEIVMDDLRDYRFYDDDMKHPSTSAINYIYERFTQTYFNKTTEQLADTGRNITKRREHLPMGLVDNEKYEQFKKETDLMELDFRKRVEMEEK